MDSIEALELFTNIDAALEQDDPHRALRLIFANFEAFEDPAPLREYTGAALAATGDVDDAVGVYVRVGAHYLNSGHPTRALAVIKKVEDLGSSPRTIVERFAALYDYRSPYLNRSKRHADFDFPTENLTSDPDTVDIPNDALATAMRTKAIESEPLAEEPQDELPPVPLLSQFPSEHLERIVRRLDFRTYDDLTQISGPGISEGQLLWTISPDVTIGDDDPTYRLRPGSLLGLHRLGLSPIAGEQEVYARNGTELLALPSSAVEELSSSVDGFRDNIHTVARRSFIEGLLEDHGLFDSLPKEQRRPVLSEFVGLELEEGTELIEQGTRSPGLFLLLDGEVSLVRADEDWEITVLTLGTGAVVGGVGLVSDREPPATVVAARSGHALHLPSETFEAVAEEIPELAKWTVGLARQRQEEFESALSAQDLSEISE